MRYKVIIAAVGLSVCLSAHAVDEVADEGVFLRAAYCHGVLQGELAQAKRTLAEDNRAWPDNGNKAIDENLYLKERNDIEKKVVASFSDSIDRINSYVAPKFLTQGDALIVPFTFAERRGDMDWRAVNKYFSENGDCFWHCQTTNDCQCVRQMPAELLVIVERARICSNLSWLPF